MAAEDTEITLGAGKLFGLFLMLAATCGIFFAVGYSLGKTSAREQALKSQTAQSESAEQEADNGKAAGAPVSTASPAKQESEAAKEPAPDLTFYKAVKQDPHATIDAASTAKPGASTVAESAKREQPQKPGSVPTETTSAADQKPAAAATASTSSLPQVSSNGTYLVQIAAVSHEEDAAALAGALRKKSYSASVVNNPTGKDKLYHVVLGPYASLQDAEAMKSKLQGEGYSPIVKR